MFQAADALKFLQTIAPWCLVFGLVFAFAIKGNPLKQPGAFITVSLFAGLALPVLTIGLTGLLIITDVATTRLGVPKELGTYLQIGMLLTFAVFQKRAFNQKRAAYLAGQTAST